MAPTCWLPLEIDPASLPEPFPSPFAAIPHSVAIAAARELQKRLVEEGEWGHDFDAVDGGKMFGVLVVRSGDGALGYLSAFSGMVAGQWQLPGFVPPLFDQKQRDAFLPASERLLADYGRALEALKHDREWLALREELTLFERQRAEAFAALKGEQQTRKARRKALRATVANAAASCRNEVVGRLARESQHDKRERRELKMVWEERLANLRQRLEPFEARAIAIGRQRSDLTNSLHRQLFDGYRLENWRGEQQSMTHFFEGGLPPSGAGDCAGPKLLHYARQQGLTPVALAEFWWGAPPRQGVRHHGHFYPACRGNCRPILPFMLTGIACEAEPQLGDSLAHPATPEILFEDEQLVVVNKPHGLLSVPGKAVEASVLAWLRQRYPDATGPLLVHRLDMSTSGLLLAAKDSATHKALQQQFERRTIEKRYLAVLSRRLADGVEQGTVELPLRVDLDDRPRQLVCYDHGKPAKSHWRVVRREAETTRVYLYPVTGRTHQLRLHAAHRQGLDAPIVGDELYGVPGERLRLHAERLRFTHPRTGERVEVFAPAPF